MSLHLWINGWRLHKTVAYFGLSKQHEISFHKRTLYGKMTTVKSGSGLFCDAQTYRHTDIPDWCNCCTPFMVFVQSLHKIIWFIWAEGILSVWKLLLLIFVKYVQNNITCSRSVVFYSILVLTDLTRFSWLSHLPDQSSIGKPWRWLREESFTTSWWSSSCSFEVNTYFNNDYWVKMTDVLYVELYIQFKIHIINN